MSKQLKYGIAFLFVVMTLLMISTQSISAAPARDDIADLDAFIQKTLQEYQVPGAAVAVVKDGKVVLAKGYGVRDISKTDKVDENTIFQLASVTKTLTGAAAGTVVDSGKLDFDTPIHNYLPEFQGYDPYMTRWLTTRDLLAMRTGWQEFTGDAVDSFGYDRAEILHRMRYFKPRYSLREVAQYSNPGFFVAGEVAGRAAGMSWNELVQKNIYLPLEMTRSGTVVKGLQDNNMSANHAFVDGKIQTVAQDILDTTGAASSGTSTAADMAKFMQMYLNHGKYKDTSVLKPETVEEILQRSMVSALSFSETPPISEATGFYYGLGVGSYDYAGYQVIEKGGALSGIRTVIVLVPEKNLGIFIAANLNLTVFPEAVRAYFLNQQFGIDPLTDQDKISTLDKQIQKLVQPPTPPANPGKFLGTLQSLVGTYENDYYGSVVISRDGENLKAEFGPAKYPASVKHWDNGAFVLQLPGATQMPTPVTFTIGADGMADSFTHEEFGLFERVKDSKQ